MTAYHLGNIAPTLPGEDEYWIAPSAVVIGRVILKKNASVWFGAVLRGDNDTIEIGEGNFNGPTQPMLVTNTHATRSEAKVESARLRCVLELNRSYGFHMRALLPLIGACEYGKTCGTIACLAIFE